MNRTDNQDLGFAEVDEILRIIDQFPAAEIVYERGDLKLHVRRAGALPSPGAAAPATVAAPAEPAPAAAASPPASPEAAPAPAAAARAPGSAGTVDRQGCVAVESPLMGVFYEAPAPGAEPFVRVGQAVEAGSDLCIIEVMKVMNTVRAPLSGVVVEIGAANANMVERGQPLVWIRPAGDAA